jgi:3-O-alpha-D-mannopyranosyl-alpha-D-mannopyranose xylosylphosphotransferase
MLTTPDHAVRVFNMINNHPRVSILGLNDDIVQGYDQIVAMMGAWFESKWPTKAAWER